LCHGTIKFFLGAAGTWKDEMTPEMMADVDEWIAKSDFGMDELNLQYH